MSWQAAALKAWERHGEGTGAGMVHVDPVVIPSAFPHDSLSHSEWEDFMCTCPDLPNKFVQQIIAKICI